MLTLLLWCINSYSNTWLEKYHGFLYFSAWRETGQCKMYFKDKQRNLHKALNCCLWLGWTIVSSMTMRINIIERIKLTFVPSITTERCGFGMIGHCEKICISPILILY